MNDEFQIGLIVGASGFNRYMVECEFIYGFSQTDDCKVLIDTWWNVNDKGYWVAQASWECFNRYMVECEYAKGTVTGEPGRYVLIDTWWNVNLLNVTLTELPEWVLIDTWWNVNATGTDSNKNLSAVLIDTWWNVNAEDCHTLILTDTF